MKIKLQIIFVVLGICSITYSQSTHFENPQSAKQVFHRSFDFYNHEKIRATESDLLCGRPFNVSIIRLKSLTMTVCGSSIIYTYLSLIESFNSYKKYYQYDLEGNLTRETAYERGLVNVV